MSVRVPPASHFVERVELLADGGDGRSVDRSALVRFSIDALETYASANFEPTVYDAMVVAAAVEFGDRSVRRPAHGWSRKIAMRVPVHDPGRWRDPRVADALHDVLGFLTGDEWAIDFVGRPGSKEVVHQLRLRLECPARTVMLFSDGMDSRAVAGLLEDGRGSLVRVRVGSKTVDRPRSGEALLPFAAIPFSVESKIGYLDSGARTRGFKFALFGGLAAFLTGASDVVLPESGQGVVGPVIVRVGRAPPDHRNHPFFTRRMEGLLLALLGARMRYSFPRIWNTKGQTLAAFVAKGTNEDWSTTRSCWRDGRWSSVDGRRRHCGLCAACMLRRLSVHAAGLTESADTYLAGNLDAEDVDGSFADGYRRRDQATLEYAIAGILHMDQIAQLIEPSLRPSVRRHAFLLSAALNVPMQEADEGLKTMLERHAAEWRAFLNARSPRSFVRRIARPIA